MQSEQAAELEQQRETLLAQLRMIDQQRIEMSAVNLSPAVSTQVKLKVEQAPATEPRIKQERTTPSLCHLSMLCLVVCISWCNPTAARRTMLHGCHSLVGWQGMHSNRNYRRH